MQQLMQQLVFIEPGKLEWQEAPRPKLEAPDDALVRPVGVTTCDVDILILHGEMPLSGPFPFGHEFVAEIIDYGEQVSGFSRGQLVVLPVQISCGACESCRRGMTAFCRAVPQPAAWGLGTFGGCWAGAFADVLRVPFAPHMMVPVPSGVSPRAIASAGDNIADAWRTVAPYLREFPGGKVLVVGRGSIGLYAVAIAAAIGASRVDYLDTDSERLALAQVFGANPIEGPSRGRVGSYHITVDAGFSPESLTCALQSTGVGGVCTGVAPVLADTPLPLLDMWRHAARFHPGPANCRANMAHVLDLVQAGRIRPERVTSAIVP
jgi:alcohol dehydrogenase